jgi:hypothetical protein
VGSEGLAGVRGELISEGSELTNDN